MKSTKSYVNRKSLYGFIKDVEEQYEEYKDKALWITLQEVPMQFIGDLLEMYKRLNKLVEYNEKIYETSTENERLMAKINLEILRGEDNE